MKHRLDCAPVSLPCDCGADLSTLLAELDAAVAKMTPGPWFVSGPFPNASIYEGRINDYDRYDPDSGQLPPKWIAQGAYRCAKNIAEDHDTEGIVALVNAYPRLREAIEQAIKTQQHMDETLRPLVEELRKDAHQARARETEACAEAARLRTERDEQAAIASNAVTKGAAYALENERLRAERDELQQERDRENVRLTVGGGLVVRGTMEAISRAQTLLLIDSTHPQEREDVRRSLARALEKVEQENERLRALMRELCDNEDGSGRLSHQIGVPCGLCTAHARINAALAQEVPRE